MIESGKAGGFTPGPWMVGYTDGSGKGCEDFRREGACITANNRCVVMGGDSGGCSVGVVAPSLSASDARWEQEMRANAHLIAAAPEMYEALRKIRAQIEKSEHWWMDCPDKGGFDVDEIDAALAKAEGKTAAPPVTSRPESDHSSR